MSGEAEVLVFRLKPKRRAERQYSGRIRLRIREAPSGEYHFTARIDGSCIGALHVYDNATDETLIRFDDREISRLRERTRAQRTAASSELRIGPGRRAAGPDEPVVLLRPLVETAIRYLMREKKSDGIYRIRFARGRLASTPAPPGP